MLVDLLVEQGHVELLVRAASTGVWSCAKAAAHQLCEAAEFERALGVLEPFVELGWEPARTLCAPPTDGGDAASFPFRRDALPLTQSGTSIPLCPESLDRPGR